jgi:16S rRNA (cytidine1402-2'-O)-methyltransferase
MGKLYLVGPLGKARCDVPLRALRILQESALIVVQGVDFVPKWLLQEDVRTPLLDIECDEAFSLLQEALSRGDIAWLVQTLSDLAGSAHHVLLTLIGRGIEPVSVPGPSSAIADLTVSGLPTDSLTFLGLLPGLSSERRALLETVADEPRTIVCEVAAEHLADVQRDLLARLGDRRVTLHGMHDTWRGQVSQAQGWPEWEGRLTLVVEGAGRNEAWSAERVSDEVEKLLAAGASPRDVARDVSRRSGWPRRQVYPLVVSAGKEE